MNPGESPEPSAPLHPDMEQLLAKVAKEEAAHAALQVAQRSPTPDKDTPQPYDFRNPSLLAPRELRKLRLHQEEFVKSLASRLSLHLRIEFSLKLTGLNTVVYSKLVESWANPSHLTLFKLEPLRGLCILEIHPQLGFSMVDRLMGGSGQAPESLAEMSEIERALLEQNVQLILEEWCGHWARVKPFKPVILGYENNGRFVQAASPETTMLVLSLDAKLGECAGQIQIGFPYVTIEPLIRHLNQGVETVTNPAPQPSAAPPAAKWNPSFNDVCIALTAEWQGLEMTARDVLALKVGDVLPMTSECAQQVTVRVESLPKFQGRPGTIAGKWAVELTQITPP